MSDIASPYVVADKVFDTDNNEVAAKLRVWGPETVDDTLCMFAQPAAFHPEACAPNPHYDGQSKPIIAADDLRIAIPVALMLPRREPLCPECFSPNICEQTRPEEMPWGCLDCSAEFDAPLPPDREEPKVEPGYTVLAVYLDNNQPYANDVYTWGGVEAAEEIAQRICREDNDAETGDDLLRIVGVIEGVHAVHGGDMDGD